MRFRLPLLALAIAIACSGDAHVGCSPTLTCSLRAARFVPPPEVDAGPQHCVPGRRGCAVQQVSSGGRHACALTLADDVLCWGDDSQGQLGKSLDPVSIDVAPDAGTRDASNSDASAPDASALDASAPDAFAGDFYMRFPRVVENALQVAAGGEHACALLHDGSVSCWGRAAEGQVDGTSDRARIDAPVSAGVHGASQISAGGLHSCALLPSMGVACWGSAQHAQTGVEQTPNPTPPTVVAGTSDATQVAAGARHTCALLSSGQVTCWGELLDAQSGEPIVSVTPELVSGLDDAIEISAGAGHNCALKSDHSVVCWGMNDDGRLGDGTTNASAVPVATPLIGAWHVAAGGGALDGRLVGHSCAVASGFELVCWGRNAEGQLGIGVGVAQSKPVIVLGSFADSEHNLEHVQGVSLGALHSCAWRSNGAVYCWGDDTSTQLGRGMPDDRQDPDPYRPGRASRVRRFGSTP